jgi:hypothetical protein
MASTTPLSPTPSQRISKHPAPGQASPPLHPPASSPNHAPRPQTMPVPSTRAMCKAAPRRPRFPPWYATRLTPPLTSAAHKGPTPTPATHPPAAEPPEPARQRARGGSRRRRPAAPGGRWTAARRRGGRRTIRSTPIGPTGEPSWPAGRGAGGAAAAHPPCARSRRGPCVVIT